MHALESHSNMLTWKYCLCLYLLLGKSVIPEWKYRQNQFPLKTSQFQGEITEQSSVSYSKAGHSFCWYKLKIYTCMYL